MARKAKRAIKKTIKDYEEYGLITSKTDYYYQHCNNIVNNSSLESCALCLFALELSERCLRCPWMVLEGQACMDKPFTSNALSLRLRRLRSWLKKCDNIINKEAS